MSTTVRHTSPARRALVLILAALLAVFCLAGSLPPGAAAQSGSNDELTNEQLVAQAVANMHALTSYHFEFEGVEPAGAVTPTKHLTLSGDVQGSDKGSRLKMAYARQITASTITRLDLAIGVDQPTDVLITPMNEMYLSVDGGQTWRISSPGDFARGPLAFVCPLSSGAERCEDMIAHLTFRDGSPRTEVIGGVPTRHLVADVSAPADASSLPEAKTVSVWISLNATPRIRQMRIDAVTSAFQTTLPRPVLDVAFSPDGATLAVAVMDKGALTIVVWNLRSPDRPPTRLTLPPNPLPLPLGAIAFSPDGKMLAATTWGSVALWQTDDLAAAPRQLPFSGGLPAIAFSPDGRLLAAAGRDAVYLWAAPYQEAKPRSLPGAPTALTFAPDGQTLAVIAQDGRILVYDLRDWQADPTVLAQGTKAKHLAFSPDGRFLAANGESVRVWDLRLPGSAPVVWPGGTEIRSSVVFSPDSRWLAAVGPKDEVQFWDVSQGLPAGPSPTPAFALSGDWVPHALAFSPDGQQLAAGCYDSTVRMWNMADVRAQGNAANSKVLNNVEPIPPAPYTLTWTFSRFNEDFGVMQAPSSTGAGGAPSGNRGPVGMPVTGAPLIWPVAALLACALVLLEVGIRLRGRRGLLRK